MLTLYYSPGACSMAAHIVLEELGHPYEAKPIALAKGEQFSETFAAINWKKKVPVLVVDGKPLTENVAILTWLAWSNPAAKLFPAAGSFEGAEALSLLSWINSGVHPILGRLFAPQKVCDMPGSADAVKAIAITETGKNFAAIEAMLTKKDYLLGTFSIIDAYAFVMLSWAKHHALDLSTFPNCLAFHDRMSARPAVQRVLASEFGTAAA